MVSGAAVPCWATLVGRVAAVFTAPSFPLFTDLMAGWALTLGRRVLNIKGALPASRLGRTSVLLQR